MILKIRKQVTLFLDASTLGSACRISIWLEIHSIDRGGRQARRGKAYEVGDETRNTVRPENGKSGIQD